MRHALLLHGRSSLHVTGHPLLCTDLEFNCRSVPAVLYYQKLITELAVNRVATCPLLDQFGYHAAFERDLILCWLSYAHITPLECLLITLPCPVIVMSFFISLASFLYRFPHGWFSR
jgi:hypothetical protein